MLKKTPNSIGPYDIRTSGGGKNVAAGEGGVMVGEADILTRVG